MMQKLILGDCLEKMREIPDESVDIVIADPPYDINLESWDVIHSNKNSALGGSSPAQKTSSFSRRGKPINGWSKADKNAPKEYQEWCEKWLQEIYRITKEASPVLVFNSRRLFHRLASAAENQNFVVKDILIWKKDRANGKAQSVNKIPAIKNADLHIEGYRVGNLKPMFEPILFCIKPYEYTLAKCILDNKLGGFFSEGTDIKENIFSHNLEKKTIHPTQKPESLIADLIKTFSFEGQLVFDPFAGSGTTCLAAKNLGRQFIGIEKEEKYFNIANKRIFGENVLTV